MYVPHTHDFQNELGAKYASKASMPLHKSYDFSIRGYKYTSTLVDVQDSLPGMIRANIRK